MSAVRIVGVGSGTTQLRFGVEGPGLVCVCVEFGHD